MAAFYTVTDAWEKRQQKGILITIGDEKSHSSFTNNKGILKGQGSTYTDKELFDKASEKWEIYHIHANDGGYNSQGARGIEIVDYWEDLIGDRFMIVENHKDIAETIAKLSGNFYKTNYTQEGIQINKIIDESIIAVPPSKKIML